MRRWTALIWVVGFWAGFWVSSFGWANPYIALFGSISGCGLLVVAIIAISEKAEELER